MIIKYEYLSKNFYMSTALASMEGHARIKSTAIPVLVALASLAPTASMRSMSVTLSPVSMEESVKMPWSPSAAPVPRVTLATVARYIHTHIYKVLLRPSLHLYVCRAINDTFLFFLLSNQTPVDWCRRSSPCQNGGRCRQKDASFICECTNGWSGRYCDIPRVSCETAARQRGTVIYILIRSLSLWMCCD